MPTTSSLSIHLSPESEDQVGASPPVCRAVSRPATCHHTAGVLESWGELVSGLGSDVTPRYQHYGDHKPRSRQSGSHGTARHGTTSKAMTRCRDFTDHRLSSNIQHVGWAVPSKHDFPVVLKHFEVLFYGMSHSCCMKNWCSLANATFWIVIKSVLYVIWIKCNENYMAYLWIIKYILLLTFLNI